MGDNKEMVLPMLRTIASSESKEDYSKNASELKSRELRPKSFRE